MGEEENKSEEGKKGGAPHETEEKRKDKMKPEEPKAAELPQLPLPPPQEIILKVYMHCEGCARKVRRCLKDFEGVEDVITDCRTSKVVVKGEKADPLKVLERVQKKSHRQVELVSPIPKPPAEEDKKPEEMIEVHATSEEKKKEEEEPPVVTAVLGVYMHCEACAQEIKKRIQRMKGVESAEADLKSSQVTVKGVFDPKKLVDHVWKRTGKHAVITKLEPEMKPEEEGDKVKKVEEGENETKKVEKGGEKEEKNHGGGAGNLSPPEEAGEEEEEEEDSKMEFKRHEFFQNYPQNYQVYPQSFALESYAAYPPPQMFSDENPNACFVM